MGKRLLVIHGPNLNLLGKREPSIYGSMTFNELNAMIKKESIAVGMTATIRQSNHEGELVDFIQAGADTADVIIINPGGYTHTSVAIRDALLAIDTPTIEVHMSNIKNREEFRHHSYISDIAVGTIAGFGATSYRLAITAAAEL